MKKRALIIAETANPEWNSLPLAAWSLSQALREVADVHLVTQVRNRPAMLRAGLAEGSEFTSIDTERLAEPLYRLAVRLGGGEGGAHPLNAAFQHATYAYFEQKVWRKFKTQLKQGDFDLVHRLTPISPNVGGYLAARCKRIGVPFVWGPIDGSVPWPKGFEQASELPLPATLLEGVKMLPRYREARDNAAALMMGSALAMAELPARWQDRCVYVPDGAIADDRLAEAPSRPEVELPLRVCFVGRLIPEKGVDMLLEALGPLMREGKATLTVVGDGGEAKYLKTQCDHLQVQDKVRFTGFVPRRELAQHLAEAHVFGFAGIHELGAAAVLEAMAAGLPPVVVDYASPGELVTPSCGWKVPITNRGQIVQSLRAVFSSIIADPAEVRRRGDAARARVERWFTWPKKAEMIAQVYDWVTGGQTNKPPFDVPLPD